MEYKGSTLPYQKVSARLKTKEWKEQSVDSILGRSKIGGFKYQRQKVAYDIMDSNFNLEDLKYVTNPYKVEEGFPAKMQDINLITPNIRLLLGEESKRPQDSVVFRTGEDATDEVIDKQKQMIYDNLVDSIMSETDPESDMQALKESLQETQKYIKNKYYSPSEIAASNTLRYLKYKLDLPDIFLKGFEDGLVSNDEIYYVGIVNGEPFVERVNPLTFSYDRSPDLKGIEEGDWCVRRMEMTASDIHDRFYDIMDEKTFDSILKHINDGTTSSQGTGSTVNTDYINWRNVGDINGGNLNEEEAKGDTIFVDHAVWRSYKKIGYLTFINEEGKEQTTIVDESYKADADEVIEWDWIDEVWEGYRAGENIHFGIQPTQYQDYSVEDPHMLKLPYVGSWYNGNNSVGKSLVELMKPLQYFYLILFYRLELTLARDKGKILNMDITQIPASMGIDEYKWLHHLTAQGINFINPYEEGWDIPGREGGKPASFNQMSVQDLSMSNVITGYIELMNKIEEMIGELSGVSKARRGQIHQSSLVGNVKQEITQSSHITEHLFWRHNRVKNNVLRLLLDVAKFAWRRSDKTRIGFVLEGSGRSFIDINDDFLYSEFDTFVTDSTKEKESLAMLESLYQPAMQNGATLLDISSIMTSESISEVKVKLQEIEDNRAIMIQQQQQAEEAKEEKEQQLKTEELRIKEEDSIRKSQTDIQVALIGQAGNEQEVDTEGKEIEKEKLKLQSEKQSKELTLKKEELSEKERSNRAKESIAKQNKNKK